MAAFDQEVEDVNYRGALNIKRGVQDNTAADVVEAVGDGALALGKGYSEALVEGGARDVADAQGDTDAVNALQDQVVDGQTIDSTIARETTDDLTKISQFRKAGGSSSEARIRARTSVNKALANPVGQFFKDDIIKAADKFIGEGTGTGGLFELSPAEKAQRAYSQEVHALSLTLKTDLDGAELALQTEQKYVQELQEMSVIQARRGLTESEAQVQGYASANLLGSKFIGILRANSGQIPEAIMGETLTQLASDSEVIRDQIIASYSKNPNASGPGMKVALQAITDKENAVRLILTGQGSSVLQKRMLAETTISQDILLNQNMGPFIAMSRNLSEKGMTVVMEGANANEAARRMWATNPLMNEIVIGVDKTVAQWQNGYMSGMSRIGTNTDTEIDRKYASTIFPQGRSATEAVLKDQLGDGWKAKVAEIAQSNPDTLRVMASESWASGADAAGLADQAATAVITRVFSQRALAQIPLNSHISIVDGEVHGAVTKPIKRNITSILSVYRRYPTIWEGKASSPEDYLNRQFSGGVK